MYQLKSRPEKSVHSDIVELRELIPLLALAVCVQAILISEGSGSSSSIDIRSIQYCLDLRSVCNLIQQNCGSMITLSALLVFLQAILRSEGISSSDSRSIQYCLDLSHLCHLIQQHCGSMIPLLALVVCVQAIRISEGSSSSSSSCSSSCGSSSSSSSNSISMQYEAHLRSVCNLKEQNLFQYQQCACRLF